VLSTVNDVPIVSIVTPAYNQGRFLAETIESVLAQTYPRIEYLVFDDGSTDDTPLVAASFGEQIRYERHQNIGQALTLNRGWEMAVGEYLGYLSSDDLLCQGAVDELAAVLREDSNCVCVFPDCDLIDEQSRVVKHSVSRPFDLAQLVVEQECYIGPGALFRRSAFEHVGGWRSDLRLAPDREFWMRLASQGTIRMLPRSLARYRIHAGAISYKDTEPEVAREYLRVLDSFFETASVPPSIRARKDEAYGRAHLVVARNCFRSSKWKQGMTELRRACELHPPLAGVKTSLRLTRNVVSKPVRIAMAKLRQLLW